MSPNIVREYDKYLFQLFLLLLLWAPIPLGSNRPWSAMLLVFVSAALLSTWLILFIKGKVGSPPALFQASWAILSLVCFQCWVLIQTLALPDSLLSTFSPEAYKLYQQVASSAGPYLSISVDNSLKALVLGLGVLLAFVLTLLLVTSPERKQLFYKTLVISGLIQASIGIVMLFIDHEIMSELRQVFHSNQSSASGTFVNSNHFAGYINICLAVGIGLLISQFKPKRSTGSLRNYLRSVIESTLSANVRLRIYLMIMLIGLILSYSRMGNLAFFAALSVSALVFLIQEKKLNIKVLIFIISLLVIDVLIVGAWFGSDKLVDRIESTDVSNNTRVDINAVSRPLMLDFFFVGAGADAFKVIEPAYNTQPSDAITEHAHNDYYEFMINTGVIGGLCLLIFMTIVIRQLFRNPPGNAGNTTDFALVMMIVYVAIHSLADFNLHIPAFAYTFVACLALAFVNKQFEQHKAGKESIRHA